MTEINVPACPTHGARPRALHSESFQGIVEVIEELIGTVSGVGTISYSRCAYGYPWNFEGVVRALEDLNTSISGIQGGGGGIDPSGILAGSGVYVSPSGSAVEIGVNLVGFAGVSVTYSGDFAVISGAEPTASAVVSGVVGGNGIVITTSGDSAVISTDLRGEGYVDFGYDSGTGVISGATNISVSDVLGGDGITITPSGDKAVVSTNLRGEGNVAFNYDAGVGVVSGLSNAVLSGVLGGDGITITPSGDRAVISTNLRGEGLVNFGYAGGVGVASGITNTVLSGANTTVNYSGIYTIINGSAGGGGGGGGSGVAVIVSGDPGTGYTEGTLWFDTNQGRLFVYASGNGIAEPAWYQTNAEALAYKSELPPSGLGLNAPPRDGSLWFNSLLGSLFVYDATTSGWYETGPSRSFAYGPVAPPPSTQGAGWYDSANSRLRVWDGSQWVQV